METEITWIDAWIRWDRNSKEILDDDENLEEEERVPPTTKFSFDYQLPARELGSSCGLSSRPLDLTLTLKGFPSESEQIWNSTGLTLWPSSHYLCEYLLDHFPNLVTVVSEDDTTPTSKMIPVRKIRAVELGSGLGRCGLLLHHLLGMQDTIGSHVYLTDGDTDTLAQLRDNVIDNTNRNGRAESVASAENDDKDNDDKNSKARHHSALHDVSCHQLLWGRDSTAAFCESHFSNPSVGESFDASNNTDFDNQHSDKHMARNGVDLVFGSDLIYAPRVIGPLFETVSTLLKHGYGTNRCHLPQNEDITSATTHTTPIFLMAHSDRRKGSSVTLNMVLEGAENAGLELEILQTKEREGIYIIAFRAQQPTND